MQEPLLEQHLHHDRHAAHSVDVEHHILTERLEVAKERDTCPDPVEVLDVELEAALVGDGRQVQDGVGRAAERHDDRDRVLDGLAGDDVSGRDAPMDEFDHGLASAAPQCLASAVDRRRRG